MSKRNNELVHNPEVKFLINSGHVILKAIKTGVNTNNTIAGKEWADKSIGTVSNHIHRLSDIGLVYWPDQKDIKKNLKHKNKKLSGHGKSNPIALTGDGDEVLRILNLFEKERISYVEDRILAIIHDNPIGNNDTIRIKGLIDQIIAESEKGLDSYGSMFRLHELIRNIESKRILHWYHDVSVPKNSEDREDKDITRFIQEIPEMKISINAKEQGLRIVARYVANSKYQRSESHSEQSLFGKLCKIALKDSSHLGGEAFAAIKEFRNVDGEIPNKLLELYLELIWIAHTINHNGPLTYEQRLLEVIYEWREALSENQKAALQRVRYNLDSAKMNDYKSSVLGSTEVVKTARKLRAIDQSLLGAFNAQIDRLIFRI